jgi:hypothetical protein
MLAHRESVGESNVIECTISLSACQTTCLSARLSRHVLSLFTVHFDETKLFAGCAKICKHSSIEDTKMSFTVT